MHGRDITITRETAVAILRHYAKYELGNNYSLIPKNEKMFWSSALLEINYLEKASSVPRLELIIIIIRF